MLVEPGRAKKIKMNFIWIKIENARPDHQRLSKGKVLVVMECITTEFATFGNKFLVSTHTSDESLVSVYPQKRIYNQFGKARQNVLEISIRKALLKCNKSKIQTSRALNFAP